ncbi:MAG: (Fe-S)-binding protein [Sulfolobales archaeon]
MVYTKEELRNDASKFIDYCKQCGFCTPACPVLKVSDFIETYGPRGRLLQTRGVVLDELKPRVELTKKIYCTLCGFCEVKCIAALKLTDLYLATRHYLRDSDLTPEEIKLISDNINKVSNPYGVDQAIKAMWMDYLPEKPQTGGKVLYWAGCTSSIRGPETSANAYQLISSLVGDGVGVLDSEPCCGWPLYLAGDLEGYKKQLTKALEAIKTSGAEVVVTTCPACTRSLRDKAKELGISNNVRIYHIVEYLTQPDIEGRLPKLKLNETITYHDPCELGRHMKILKEPRQIINKIEGIKLIEMRGNQLESNCCGGGGLYLPLNPERSSSIALNRLSDVPRGVRKLVTACPSCEVQLSTAAQNAGLDVEVLDISELILKALTATDR